MHDHPDTDALHSTNEVAVPDHGLGGEPEPTGSGSIGGVDSAKPQGPLPIPDKPLGVCQECGAIVGHKDVHDRWHRRMEDAEQAAHRPSPARRLGQRLPRSPFRA